MTASAPSGGLDVLVIEDNAGTRELMRTLLESWGHHVVMEADGTHGLAQGLQMRPDVAVVDVGRQGIDSYQVAENLRSSEIGQNVRLVALTGCGRPEDRAPAIESEFDRHLVKPVQPETLHAILTNVATRRPSQATQV